MDYYIVHLTWGKGNAHFPIYKIIHQNDIIEYLENISSTDYEKDEAIDYLRYGLNNDDSSSDEE